MDKIFKILTIVILFFLVIVSVMLSIILLNNITAVPEGEKTLLETAIDRIGVPGVPKFIKCIRVLVKDTPVPEAPKFKTGGVKIDFDFIKRLMSK